MEGAIFRDHWNMCSPPEWREHGKMAATLGCINLSYALWTFNLQNFSKEDKSKHIETFFLNLLSSE
jgi:hypothetical protein